MHGGISPRSCHQGAAMFMQSIITKSALLSLALVASTTSALAAQERLFEWNGRVDGEVRIFVRGNDVWTQEVRGRRNQQGQARLARALPNRPGQVRVQLAYGRGDARGDARVIQQPSSRNNYTAVVQVRDDGGRADRYRVVAYWQPIGRGGWSGGDLDRDNDRADGMLRWIGAVDNEVEIRINGRNVETRNLSGNGARDVRANIDGRPLPRRDVDIRVRERQGRGTVTVVQQPRQWNGYTAVIRVRDPQGGFGYYDLDVSW
jgi:hypothetical protein